MAQEKITGHAKVETSNFLMIVLILLVVSIGGLVEIVPLFFQKSTTQPIEGLKPYTALQVIGRDVGAGEREQHEDARDGQPDDGESKALNAEEKAVCEQLGLSEEDFIKERNAQNKD